MKSYKEQDRLRSWYMGPVAVVFMCLVLPVLALLYICIALGERFGGIDV